MKKFKTPAFYSLVTIVVFTGLMVFGLRRDPNLLPSQLMGKPAPAFTAVLVPQGQLSFPPPNPDKRWTVLNFWTTSCYVCREEAPEWQNLFQSWADRQDRPRIFSVNIQDTPEAISQYRKAFRISFPVISDLSGRISLDYGVYGTPETFFIDDTGLVRYRLAGATHGTLILAFIQWLKENPQASFVEVTKGFWDVKARL